MQQGPFFSCSNFALQNKNKKQNKKQKEKREKN